MSEDWADVKAREMACWIARRADRKFAPSVLSAYERIIAQALRDARVAGINDALRPLGPFIAVGG